MKRYLGLCLFLAACGGASAERPLELTIGMSRDRLPAALHRYDYCRGEPTQEETELFPRCDQPGVEFGQSWVIAQYEGERVVRVQRWERYPEQDRAMTRFNSLVEQRSAKSGPATDEARGLIVAQQRLPMGTRTWVAFRVGEHALVGVYLLNPVAPDYANVLEEIVELRPDTEPLMPIERGCTDCAPAE